jgi:dihydropyrimidinase
MGLLYTFGVHTGRLSLTQWVDACSTGPAQMFGLYPRKGSLEVGADADIVIFDPDKKITLTADFLHENVDYTPYEGLELRGYPVTTLARGQVIVQDMQYIGGEPQGAFIPRDPFGRKP